MSQNNLEIMRGMYDAFVKGDVPSVMAVLDPELEWREAENFIYADRNPYVGPTAVLEGVFMRLATEWEGSTVSPGEILDAGAIVVGRGHYSGAYNKTGKQVRAQFAHVFTLRDGKVIKFQQYTDTAQFERAVNG